VPIAVPDLRSDARTQDILLTATIEDLMTDYRAILEARGALTPEDEELIMNLSTVYLKQRETWKLESRQETLETVAIALLREGVDVELILKTTGIDRDLLETLKSHLT
jgi:hypothetical protein